MPGKRIIPEKIVKLRGVPDCRSKNRRDLKAPDGIPEFPDSIEEGTLAAKEWERICHDLNRINLLSTVDRIAVEQYCHVYARMRIAQQEIDGEGITIETPHGKKKNPAVPILEKATDQIRQFLTEFGLTPAARAKLSIKENKEDSDFGSFIKKRARSQ